MRLAFDRFTAHPLTSDDRPDVRSFIRLCHVDGQIEAVFFYE
jgi:hypothetical protein